jgi:hypothetical protein
LRCFGGEALTRKKASRKRERLQRVSKSQRKANRKSKRIRELEDRLGFKIPAFLVNTIARGGNWHGRRLQELYNEIVEPRSRSRSETKAVETEVEAIPTPEVEDVVPDSTQQ